MVMVEQSNASACYVKEALALRKKGREGQWGMLANEVSEMVATECEALFDQGLTRLRLIKSERVKEGVFFSFEFKVSLPLEDAWTDALEWDLDVHPLVRESNWVGAVMIPEPKAWAWKIDQAARRWFGARWIGGEGWKKKAWDRFFKEMAKADRDREKAQELGPPWGLAVAGERVELDQAALPAAREKGAPARL
jgi:hypothetical protein